MPLFESLRTFMHAGGGVLWLILLVSIFLWALIFERMLFFYQTYPKLRESYLQQWRQRSDKCSKQAVAIRKCLISEAKIEMQKSVLVIRMLVALCPLLGLLGTVVGMIHVFDVLAVTGTGNARAMASGVSRATITTMAGMVVAIAGLYCSRLIDDRVNMEIHKLSDLLKFH